MNIFITVHLKIVKEEKSSVELQDLSAFLEHKDSKQLTSSRLEGNVLLMFSC